MCVLAVVLALKLALGVFASYRAHAAERAHPEPPRGAAPTLYV